MGQEAFNEFHAHNAVYSPVIPSLGKIEDDLIGYTVDILRGGEEGKVEIARDAMKFKERFEREIDALPNATVYEADLTPLVFTVDHDPEAFLGGMLEKGWYLMGHMEPPMFQVILDSYPEELADGLISSIKDVLAALARGESFPKVGLGYTFTEGGEDALAGLPLWVQRAVPLMKKI